MIPLCQVIIIYIPCHFFMLFLTSPCYGKAFELILLLPWTTNINYQQLPIQHTLLFRLILLMFILQVVQNKPYLVLMVTFGSGIGLFTCLQTLLEQIICPRGYSDVSMNLAAVDYIIICFIFHAQCSSMIIDSPHGRKFIILTYSYF